MNIAQEVGQCIRKFRKNRNLSQVALAKRINKSKSTLSKYESGEICIDLHTLYDISKALNVSIDQFTDFLQAEEKAEYKPGGSDTLPAFFSLRKLYLYFWDGRNRSLNTSVLCIGEQMSEAPWSYRADLYMNVKDLADYTLCENSYEGSIEFHHVLTNICMVHKLTPIEHIMISILENFTPSETKIALFNGISFRPLTPIVFKMLVSRNPLKENDPVMKDLYFSKEEIKRIKLHNYFTV